MSEITEEKEEESPSFTSAEDQKERIRRIIEYQKSLYSSSSPSSFSAVTFSSFSSSSRNSSLLHLMRGGSTSLRRLFEMEHTSLATHFEEYSGSPIIKPLPLWGSDEDGEIHESWPSINRIGLTYESESSYIEGEYGFQNREVRTRKRKLTRKKSFKRLPGFGIWRGKGFRFRLRLRRLRILICGRKF